MGSIIKIVPVHEFDVAEHQRAILASEEAHAADKKQIAVVKRELSALTRAQRRSSRWPTKAELKKSLERVGTETGAALWFGPYSGRWKQGSVTTYDDDGQIVHSLLVNADDEDYYCEGDSKSAALFARAVAQVAGPQVTFLAEDYSPAEYTGLFVPESRKPAANKAKQRRARPISSARTATAGTAARGS